MSDVKSFQPPRAVLPAGVPGPAPASVARKSDVDDKSVSTDVVSSTPTSSEALRSALIAELLTSNRSTEVNRFYQGTVNAWTDLGNAAYAGSAVTLSAVPQGTAANQRLGSSIRLKRLRVRIHLRPGQISDAGVAGVPTDVQFSYATRVIVGIDKMPVIGTPVYVDTSTWDIGSGYPSSPSATHTNPRADFTGTPATFAGQMCLAVRNPQTLSRYHLLYDRIHNRSSDYPSYTAVMASGSTASEGWYRTHSEYIELDFDLRGIVSQWFAQLTDTAIMTNSLFILLVADSPTLSPSRYKYMSELEFENVA